MADIEYRDNPGAFRYEALEGGAVVSQIDYLVEGDVLSFTHTGTPPQHRGRGLATGLAEFALDDLRATGRKVQPLCPFIAAFIEEHSEYADLVAKS